MNTPVSQHRRVTTWIVTILTIAMIAVLVGLMVKNQRANAALLGMWKIHSWKPGLSDVVTVAQVKAALDSGADVNARNRDFETPLGDAAFEGDTACVKYLVAHGADVNQVTSLFGSPLEAAIYSDNMDCVRLLVAHGAKVNARAKAMQVPIIDAAECGHVDCVKSFLFPKART